MFCFNSSCCCFHSTQSSLKDNSEALATVTGIVDGTGSVGAAIGQVSGGISNTIAGCMYMKMVAAAD